MNEYEKNHKSYKKIDCFFFLGMYVMEEKLMKATMEALQILCLPSLLVLRVNSLSVCNERIYKQELQKPNKDFTAPFLARKGREINKGNDERYTKIMPPFFLSL